MALQNYIHFLKFCKENLTLTEKKCIVSPNIYFNFLKIFKQIPPTSVKSACLSGIEKPKDMKWPTFWAMQTEFLYPVNE